MYEYTYVSISSTSVTYLITTNSVKPENKSVVISFHSLLRTAQTNNSPVIQSVFMHLCTLCADDHLSHRGHEHNVGPILEVQL